MKTALKQKKSILALAVTTILSGHTGMVWAEETAAEETSEVIQVTGIRSALASALNQKRDTTNLTEIIKAEDIGKLPDNNLAEVLENVTGVQITRTAGVGTGVQIRGTGSNRVEINGVSTVGSGSGRTGISFDDLPAALIAAVEVTKAPTAKTVEGSVGGTINLRTLRGNSLSERLIQLRVQGEHSDLADSITPRLSGTYGDNWETDAGKIGVVLTASYAEQDVASINPRFDRDRVLVPSSGDAFLRTQFLDQPIRATDYQTTNFTGSIEFAPNDNLKFYFDATLNDQERAGQGSRAYFSGTGNGHVIPEHNNTSFTTIDLGSVKGRNGVLDLGEVLAVTSGVIGVGTSDNGAQDPNLRIDGNTNSRLTESSVYALGTEWRTDKMQLNAELSYSDSDTTNPGLNSTLDFINPNAQQPAEGTSADNGTPAIFKMNGKTFEFGIAPNLDETPTTAHLLNAQNYALNSVSRTLNNNKGDETAARVDIKYDVTDLNTFFVDLNAGIRWNKTTSTRVDSNSKTTFSNWDRPRASLFEDIIVAGPNNFDGAGDRSLFIPDYLMIDNDIAFNDPNRVITTLNQAITTNNSNTGANNALIGDLDVSTTSFFDIEETTTALYLQGDYEAEVGDILLSGNLGVRYITTDLTSQGVNEINDSVETVQESSSYDFILPRFNLSAEIIDGLFTRIGIGKDIRRPNFNDLSPSTKFGNSPYSAVVVGNPQLEPEQIWSYDLAFEYYVTPSSLVSVGFFLKDRKDVHVTLQDEPAKTLNPTSGLLERDVVAPCEGGGIFNPNVSPNDYNVESSRTDTYGICVARQTKLNGGSATQKGIEISAQYDLGEYEDELGWASGFGIIANYTHQESSDTLDLFADTKPTDPINQLLGRTDTDGSTPTLADDVVSQRSQLADLSEDAYNFTLFYDKYDFNVRMRYTWRSDYNPATSGVMRFNLPPVVGSRGQLNMSVGYDITDSISVGVEGVNLTREDSTVWCFNEGALLCEQDIADRRITFGITAKL